MNQRIGHIALVVENYDKAIEFYVQKLNFDLIEDTKLSDTKRWVIIAPKGQGGCQLLLAQASNKEQLSCVGNQTGGRVFLFLYTDDFDRDYLNLVNHKTQIIHEPVSQPWGRVVVFTDLYGNLWDLIEEPKTKDVAI